MVSVCMATYNGGRFLREQIDSILCQLGEGDELIISDDGSTDDTIDIMKSYADGRIKLLHHQKDPSIAKRRFSRNFYYATQNFENALKQAKGDYIFFSDQDDVWRTDKVEKMCEALVEAEIVMCNFAIINEIGKVVNSAFYDKNPVSDRVVGKILKSKVLGCCLAFRKCVLEKALPFPDPLLCHDLWIGCMSSNFAYLETPYHFYRRTSDNVSTSTQRSSNPLYYRLWYRIKIFFLIEQRLLQLKIN